MKRSILFFGHVRDVAGMSSIEAAVPSDVCDVPALIAWLSEDNAQLGAALRATGVRVAIDRTIARSDARLGAAAEIAFMSPLSGG